MSLFGIPASSIFVRTTIIHYQPSNLHVQPRALNIVHIPYIHTLNACIDAIGFVSFSFIFVPNRVCNCDRTYVDQHAVCTSTPDSFLSLADQVGIRAVRTVLFGSAHQANMSPELRGLLSKTKWFLASEVAQRGGALRFWKYQHLADWDLEELAVSLCLCPACHDMGIDQRNR